MDREYEELESALETLYLHLLQRPNADAYRFRTPELEAMFRTCGRDLQDAKDDLVSNARMTGFREGIRFGILLAEECALPSRSLA